MLILIYHLLAAIITIIIRFFQYYSITENLILGLSRRSRMAGARNNRFLYSSPRSFAIASSGRVFQAAASWLACSDVRIPGITNEILMIPPDNRDPKA